MKEKFQCREWTLRRLKGIIGVLIFVAGISAALAQLPTATILGTVRDSSGAVVPNATVTATSTETGQTRTAVSGGNGSYRLAALPVGDYEVRVSTPGFQTQVRSGITLTVSQEAVLNFSLEVGAVEQTVEVTAEAPLVNTTTGSLGGLVDEQSIADLPLNGRNYIDLTLLQTGVTQHKNLSMVAGMSGIWFSSNGAPLRSNNYLLDGAPMQDVYGASSASVSNATLGVEGIREYRVVTNSFSAEYGMTMGSQMVIVSKNGTNALHGSAFEYLRNNVLDARNFFDYKTLANPTRRLPPFRRNQFGGSAGGPIKRDHTFFHTTYEGLRERLGKTLLGNAMPLGCRVQGQICNVGATSFVTPAISPVVQPLLQFFPEPNLPSATAGGLPRYTFPFTQPTREDYGQVRIDQNFSSTSTFFGRYTIDDTQQTQPKGDNPHWRLELVNRNQYATLSENHILSPALLNTFRFSYSRTRMLSLQPSGIIGPQFSLVPGKEIGSVGPGSGISGLPSDPSPVHLKQNIFTWSDDLFWTRGAHSLKFGTLINRFQQYMLVSTNGNGGVSFATVDRFLQAINPESISAITAGSILDRTYHYTTLGFYVQDDWKMMSNFTWNLGLRYEFMTQPQEVRGHGAAIRDVQRDKDTTLGPPFENPSHKNLSPRFGFAWDVHGNGQTAVRGGFGLLYDIGNLGSALVVGTTATPPFSRISTVTRPATFTIPLFFPPEAAGRRLRTVDYHIQQPHMLQYNLTIERQLPAAMAVTVAYGGSRGINIIKTVEGNPRIPQGIVQGGSCVAASPPVPYRTEGPFCFTGKDPFTNPAWTDTEFKTGGSNSWYNSLQISLRKQLTHGLQFQSSYTWSKMIDETESQLGAENNASGSTAAWSTRPDLDKALASFDVTHNWRFNAIYRLPGVVSSGGVAGKLLNGWWMSGILSAQSGYPFSATVSADRDLNGSGDNRPNLVAGRNNDNIILGGPEKYFDPTAFSIQPRGVLGNAGRNILRGPGFTTLDFSLVKDTPLGFLGESGKLEFRSEFFNILNRANFGIPNRSVYSASSTNPLAYVEAPLSTAGRIDVASTSRQIQFALRLIF